MRTGPVADTATWARERISRVHFVGIGGVGMGGIAEVLLTMNYNVSGSDCNANKLTARLIEQGAEVTFSHQAQNVHGADVVVVSSAIKESNPELVEAHALRIPVVPRAEMLAELMRFRLGIAIAGTHGKTTTTSLVASALTEGQLDPTFVIGGRLNSAGTHAQLGQSDWLVAEADESDASFLHLSPVISVVTNIDADHLENYDGDFGKYKDTFLEFLHHLPFYGLAVLCVDDENVRAMLPKLQRKFITYGASEEADIRAFNIRADGLVMRFDVMFEDGVLMEDVVLNMPGHHNVLNALSSIVVARELGVSLQSIAKSLEEFEGVGRRVTRYGEVDFGAGSVELVDDYAHHPSELAATISAIRGAWPDRRLVAIFQPHRYSRTRDLFDDFAHELSLVDELYLSEVYAAGEQPVQGADGESLAAAVRLHRGANVKFVSDIQQMAAAVRPGLKHGDVLLTMGAGNVGALAASLPDLLTGDDLSETG